MYSFIDEKIKDQEMLSNPLTIPKLRVNSVKIQTQIRLYSKTKFNQYPILSDILYSLLIDSRLVSLFKP